MNSNSRLLDTVALIALVNANSVLQRRVSELESTYASSIALGELYFGALKSERVRENIARIEQLRQMVAIIPCDASTARHYAVIRDQLRQIGRPMPSNDYWIAAVAVQFDFVLLTRDAHFQHVDGLKLESW